MRIVGFFKKFCSVILTLIFCILLIALMAIFFIDSCLNSENVDRLIDVDEILNIKQKDNGEKTLSEIISNELYERGVSEDVSAQILKSEDLDNLFSDYVYDYIQYILFRQPKPIISYEELNIIIETEMEKSGLSFDKNQKKEIYSYTELLSEKISDNTPSVYELSNMGYDMENIRVIAYYLFFTETIVIIVALMILCLILIGSLLWNRYKALRAISIPMIFVGVIFILLSLMEVNVMSKIFNNDGLLDGIVLMVVNESLKDLLTYGIILLGVGIVLLVLTTILIKKSKNKLVDMETQPLERKSVKDNLKEHVVIADDEIEKVENNASLTTGLIEYSVINNMELPDIKLPEYNDDKEEYFEKVLNNEELPKIEISSNLINPFVEEVKPVILNEVKRNEMEMVDTEPLAKLTPIEITDNSKEIEIVEIEKTHDIEEKNEIDNVNDSESYVEISDEEEEKIIKKDLNVEIPTSLNLNITSPVKGNDVKVVLEETENKDEDVELL